MHSRFLYPSQSLLYRDLAIRNAGRACLLTRTFKSRPSLTQYCSRISYRSDSDKRISNDLINILSQAKPNEIVLGARLFSFGEDSLALEKVLKLNPDLKSFAYGTSQWSISKSIDSTGTAGGSLSLILDLLPTYTRLEELTLRNIASRSGLPLLSLTPSYQLTSLTFVNVDFWIEEFNFLFGSTSTSLKHLHLNKVHILRPPNLTVSDIELVQIHEEEMFQLLTGKIERLESLYLFEISAPFNLDSILSITSSLKSLHIGSDTISHQQSLHPTSLPLTLVDLIISGTKLFDRMELFTTSDPPITLKRLTLVGVLRSSPAALNFESRRRLNSWNHFAVVYQSIYL